MPLIAQAVFAALVLVAPVAIFSTVVGIVKDGSPFNRSFWN